MVNSEVLERKVEQAVFYQEPTLHRTLFWALRYSIDCKEGMVSRVLGVSEPKDKMRYRLIP